MGTLCTVQCLWCGWMGVFLEVVPEKFIPESNLAQILFFFFNYYFTINLTSFQTRDGDFAALFQGVLILTTLSFGAREKWGLVLGLPSLCSPAGCMQVLCCCRGFAAQWGHGML